MGICSSSNFPALEGAGKLESPFTHLRNRRAHTADRNGGTCLLFKGPETSLGFFMASSSHLQSAASPRTVQGMWGSRGRGTYLVSAVPRARLLFLLAVKAPAGPSLPTEALRTRSRTLSGPKRPRRTRIAFAAVATEVGRPLNMPEVRGDFRQCFSVDCTKQGLYLKPHPGCSL